MNEYDVMLLLTVLAVGFMSLCISVQRRQIKRLRKWLDISYSHYDSAYDDAHAFACEVVELRNDLAAAHKTFGGIAACGTCDACRGAALIALQRFSNTPQRG